MRSLCTALAALILSGAATLPVHGQQLANERVYRGAYDASAAIAISADLFIAASDDDNTLKIPVCLSTHGDLCG